MDSSARESEARELLQRSQSGDEAAWGELLLHCEPRLLRIVRLRLHPRLQHRIDPVDVVQEAFVQATRRRAEYFEQSALPFFVWLRLLTQQKLVELHRHHLGVQARDAARDISLFAPSHSATSAELVAQLLGQTTTPSRQVVMRELEQRVRDAVASLSDDDREIITLRNFEQLSNIEAASVLGIAASTASSRYVRALRKLKQLLDDVSGYGAPADRSPS